jgi:MoaA/NifB/PqqE/SkfB family radical SAM enzyme
MRFPFRLSAALFRSKVSKVFAGTPAPPPIFHFSPCVTHLSPRSRFDKQSTELEWHSPEECAARVRSIASPVVWLGGTEPLFHPEIGSAANAIVESDRYTFVHTSGYNLRQRIHEFRPDSRLFLALEFAGREEAHNRAVGRPDAFSRSMEAIRAAKLSGFLIAAHVTVAPETDACDVGELIEFLDKKDVDGFVVTSAGHAAGDSSLADTLADVRAMIRCVRWENFSKVLEASYAETAPALARGKYSAGSENAFEEGD